MSNTKVPKILIYGASSQVGSSVAMYFSQKKLADCTCLIRNANSSIFFEINSIPFYILNELKEEDLNILIKSHDTVLDFTYPSGQANNILHDIKKNMKNILGRMNHKQSYFHMSSIMAYGLPDGEKLLQYYKVPRSSYGYIKRRAELLANKLGKRNKVSIYNFRLGQTHGFLQSVSNSYRSKLSKNGIIYIDGNPFDLVNIVFVSTLCYAILDCIEKKYKPDTYTLVNYPQWTLQNLYSYYNKINHLDTNIVYVPSDKKDKSLKITYSILNFLKSYRPLLETYILFRFPLLYKKVKGRFRQTVFETSNLKTEYADFHILGTPSSSLINTKFSTVEDVSSAEQEMENLYLKTIEDNIHD